MKNVLTVAANTFREAVRDRVLYNLVFFALLMMAAAIFVGQISIGIEQSIIVSLGLYGHFRDRFVHRDFHRSGAGFERDG